GAGYGIYRWRCDSRATAGTGQAVAGYVERWHARWTEKKRRLSGIAHHAMPMCQSAASVAALFNFAHFLHSRRHTFGVFFPVIGKGISGQVVQRAACVTDGFGKGRIGSELVHGALKPVYGLRRCAGGYEYA